MRNALRDLEHDMGRVRTHDKNAPRPIDLDLVLYDEALKSRAAYAVEKKRLAAEKAAAAKAGGEKQ